MSKKFVTILLLFSIFLIIIGNELKPSSMPCDKEVSERDVAFLRMGTFSEERIVSFVM